MIRRVTFNGICYAIVVRHEYTSNGISFLNSETDSLQLGYMKRESGYQITPHFHNFIKREVNLTQEVLFIKTGKVRADLYDNERNYIESVLLNKGDIILLLCGGHAFKIIEEAEIFEVKQGPYCGNEDKTRFDAPKENSIIIN